MRKVMWKKIFNTNDSNEIKDESVSIPNDDFDFDDDVLSKDFNNEEKSGDVKHLNDDFDFGDEVVRPVGENVIKRQNTINEKEVESRAIAQMEAIKVSNAYEHIIGSFKAAPRNDNEHYEAFKAERLERFKTLDIVVADICKKHLHREAYHYDSFKNCLFNDNVKHGLIYNLCDIIQRVIHDTNNEYSDDYAELSKERQLSIKVLSIAIIDLAEGNI